MSAPMPKSEATSVFSNSQFLEREAICTTSSPAERDSASAIDLSIASMSFFEKYLSASVAILLHLTIHPTRRRRRMIHRQN